MNGNGGSAPQSEERVKRKINCMCPGYDLRDHHIEGCERSWGEYSKLRLYDLDDFKYALSRKCKIMYEALVKRAREKYEEEMRVMGVARKIIGDPDIRKGVAQRIGAEMGSFDNMPEERIALEMREEIKRRLSVEGHSKAYIDRILDRIYGQNKSRGLKAGSK